jgi:hypothetical protein
MAQSRPRARRELKRTSSSWWQDEQPVPYTGSSADPLFDDYNPGDRSAWAPGYVGEGRYSSGDFPGDEPLYDYGYGGFKGDAGFDELGDEQYGGGRYGRGPTRNPTNMGERTSGRVGARQGPKNYRRSDESILDEIYMRLLTHRGVDSSDVSIEVHHGGATLEGTVPERRMKHTIEDIVAAVRGVMDVDNRVRVRRLSDGRD